MGLRSSDLQHQVWVVSSMAATFSEPFLVVEAACEVVVSFDYPAAVVAAAVNQA